MHGTDIRHIINQAEAEVKLVGLDLGMSKPNIGRYHVGYVSSRGDIHNKEAETEEGLYEEIWLSDGEMVTTMIDSDILIVRAWKIEE